MYKLAALRDKQAQTMSDDSLVSIISSTQEVQSRHSNLLESLQTTLDLDQLLNIFAQHVVGLNACDSLRFMTDDHAFVLIGASDLKQTHQHTALLYADERYLGQLVYGLKRPISPALRRTLDQCHRHLTFPLRNAVVHAKARQQAIRDYLTGLGNRSYLEEVLQQAIYQQQRAPNLQGVLLIDLDGFKAVNDTHGHQHGDAILKNFSALLAGALRDCDQLFRFGGDEFVILLNDTSLVGVQYVFARLQQALRQHTDLQPHGLTMSAGAAMLDAEDTIESILARADKAMYNAKFNGKNQLFCLCK